MQVHCSCLLKSLCDSITKSCCCTRLLYLVFFPIFFIASPLLQANEQSIEYKVKAAYLYNFSKFTDWPDDRAIVEQNTFTLCILGDDPFGSIITPIKTKHVRKKPIKLLYFSQMGPGIKQCKILFISETQRNQTQSILLALADSNILTVGESNQFINDGGIIGFVIDNDRVQFQINKQAAKRARLEFDPRLLKLGQVVR
ncbi:MAG: YfiR family protein [Methylococcales bacterium]